MPRHQWSDHKSRSALVAPRERRPLTSTDRHLHRGGTIDPVTAVLAALLAALATSATPPAAQPGAQPAVTSQNPPTAQGPTIPKAPDADALLAQAVQLHEAGDLFGAVTNYEAYLKTNPDNAGARSNLGAAYVRLGRLPEGIAEYRKALALDPASPTYRFNLALALYKAARYAEAVTELQSTIEAAPRHLGARLLLGASRQRREPAPRHRTHRPPRPSTGSRRSAQC